MDLVPRRELGPGAWDQGHWGFRGQGHWGQESGIRKQGPGARGQEQGAGLREHVSGRGARGWEQAAGTQ